MKRLTALFLVLCLLAALPALAVETKDVTQTLKVLDIMVGDEAGELHLDRGVSRAEFAKLLVSASDQADSVSGEGSGFSLFTDVKSSHWASEYVKLCLDKGWMIGYTDGSFRPDNTVTLEEACTATLRLLGYDSGSLAGSFPAAQLSKAAAVGLRDDLTAQRGDALTRWDCALIFYNLLTCKTAQNQLYATTLGKPLDSEGEVDTLALAKEDLSDPFLWTAGSDLGFVPGTVYLNDRLTAAYTPAVGDVCYTNAALGILWVYTDQVFGQLSALSPSVGRPETVSVGGRNYTLATDQVKAKLSALGDNAVGSVVTLYLGMDGAVAGADAVNGPYVALASSRLGFTPTTVYRNGELSSSATLEANDVYYYSETSKTLWVYTDQVSGRISALAPNAVSPTSVTISGTNYTLGSESLSRELSTLNGKWTDKLVTLLLGMDGSVVKLLSGDAVSADYCGIVQTASKSAVDGAVEQQVTVVCTDGRTHSFSVSTTPEWEAGDLVRATVTGNSVTMTTLTNSYLSGTVNKGASRVGSTAFASDIEILDTADDGTAVRVDVSALSGLTLSNTNVRFYSLNTNGEVDRLILRDGTGKLWSYGYLSEVESSGRNMNTSSRYTLLLNGQSRTIQVSNKSFPVTQGNGVAVRMGADGSIAAMQGLKEVKLTTLGQLTAYSASQTFSLAEDVQVYLKDASGDCYAAELEDIRNGSFTLTGWYDTQQKQIRVILAK